MLPPAKRADRRCGRDPEARRPLPRCESERRGPGRERKNAATPGQAAAARPVSEAVPHRRSGGGGGGRGGGVGRRLRQRGAPSRAPAAPLILARPPPTRWAGTSGPRAARRVPPLYTPLVRGAGGVAEHRQRRTPAAARHRVALARVRLAFFRCAQDGDGELWFDASSREFAEGAYYSSESDGDDDTGVASTSGRSADRELARRWSIERVRLALAELSGRHWAEGDYRDFEIRGANYRLDRVKARALAPPLGRGRSIDMLLQGPSRGAPFSRAAHAASAHAAARRLPPHGRTSASSASTCSRSPHRCPTSPSTQSRAGSACTAPPPPPPSVSSSTS